MMPSQATATGPWGEAMGECRFCGGRLLIVATPGAIEGERHQAAFEPPISGTQRKGSQCLQVRVQG